MLSGANGKRGASTKRLAAAEPRRIARFDAKQNSKNFSSHHLEICAERQMSDDPVWLADNVMAFLLDRQGDAPDKSLLQSKIEANYDGKVFPFTLRFGHVAWSETTGQDYGVVVSLDERPVLHVDLYSVVSASQRPQIFSAATEHGRMRAVLHHSPTNLRTRQSRYGDVVLSLRFFSLNLRTPTS